MRRRSCSTALAIWPSAMIVLVHPEQMVVLVRQIEIPMAPMLDPSEANVLPTAQVIMKRTLGMGHQLYRKDNPEALAIGAQDFPDHVRMVMSTEAVVSLT